MDEADDMVRMAALADARMAPLTTGRGAIPEGLERCISPARSARVLRLAAGSGTEEW